MDRTAGSMDVVRVVDRAPDVAGRSKRLWRLGDDRCVVQLIPSLSSYTYQREANVDGTQRLRLDFYELCARRMAAAGVPTTFIRRLGPDTYLADYVETPPFEVIVKNAAQGSTSRKYPGLFPEGHRFEPPVVKFDYRTSPEDQPIADDYLRACGLDPEAMKSLALSANALLRDWLAPRDLLDICFIMGPDAAGRFTVTSEISPDCMRLKDPDGASLDKDLFRQGADGGEIVRVWSRLVEEVADRPIV
jgi:phosphoribosylaminoimidazole-succinocarboxamide synthase